MALCYLKATANDGSTRMIQIDTNDDMSNGRVMDYRLKKEIDLNEFAKFEELNGSELTETERILFTYI